MCRSWGDDRTDGGVVDRQGICEWEDQALKELQGDVGSAKIAEHEANMCRAPLYSSTGAAVSSTSIFGYESVVLSLLYCQLVQLHYVL